MHSIQTTDNNYGRRAVIVDGVCREGLGADILAELSPYSGVPISVLAESNPNFFVFPRRIGSNEDDIGSSCLYSLPGGEFSTHNIAGVFGIGNGDNRISVSIRSRFDREEGHQFFLNSMLRKVLGINLLNLDTSSGEDRIWDLFPYLFPFCLDEAIGQGLFRAYRLFACNNDDIRGSIDVARHISENMPFRGSVAYEVREHTENNAVMQLVRHTIEYIESNPGLAHILHSDEIVRRNVSTVKLCTPDYHLQARRQIVMKNLRPVQHPYYTKWSDLQRLCVRILCRDKLSFDGKGQNLHGVVFDVAWLWEEYLARELVKYGYTHAENKTGKHPMSLYADRTHSVYPDFRSESRGIILDAKYKCLDCGNVAREDLYQMVTYVHTLPCGRGRCAVLLYPKESEGCAGCKPERVGILNGYGGEILKLSFKVPKGQDSEDFVSYEKKMRESMKWFIDALGLVEQLVEHGECIKG